MVLLSPCNGLWFTARNPCSHFSVFHPQLPIITFFSEARFALRRSDLFQKDPWLEDTNTNRKSHCRANPFIASCYILWYNLMISIIIDTNVLWIIFPFISYSGSEKNIGLMGDLLIYKNIMHAAPVRWGCDVYVLFIFRKLFAKQQNERSLCATVWSEQHLLNNLISTYIPEF